MRNRNLDLKKTETEIILALQEELFYYQAVTDILSRQRDLIKSDSLEKLGQLFEQMQKEESLIQESTEKIDDLAALFYRSGIIPCLEITKLLNQIEKAVNTNLALLKETEGLVAFKRDKVRIELRNLTYSKQLSKYGRTSTPPQFIDRKN